MNLYTYLNAKRIDASQIPSVVFEPTKRLINQIRSLPIPFARQEQMIFKLLHKLNQNLDDTQTVIDQYQEQLDHEQEVRAHSSSKWFIEVWDALMAISGWIVLFDVLFDQLIDHQNLMGMMSFGLSNLFSAIGLYVVCRALIAVIIRFDHGIWRWLGLAGLFSLFMAIRYFSQMTFIEIQVSVLVVALVFCLLFGLSLWKLNCFYGTKREEKRIQ